VKITDPTHGAIIYYSTDGWTPTEKLLRYMGPIEINSTIMLQAVAVAPYHAPSATREGDASPPNAAVLIPVVGPFTVFKHGKDADNQARHAVHCASQRRYPNRAAPLALI
jgi:hypothetical protein